MLLFLFFLLVCTFIFILFLPFSLSVFFSLFIPLSGFLSVFCPFLPISYHFYFLLARSSTKPEVRLRCPVYLCQAARHM